jgi:hypothetical protein
VNELKNKELSNGGVIPFETGEKVRGNEAMGLDRSIVFLYDK